MNKLKYNYRKSNEDITMDEIVIEILPISKNLIELLNLKGEDEEK